MPARRKKDSLRTELVVHVPDLEWHTYRRDHQLSGRCPRPGNITRPAVRWSFRLGGSEHEVFTIPSADGGADLLIAEGGGVVCYDRTGRLRWKSKSCGINALAGVFDLDGDGSPEIVAGSGYELFVLASGDGRILLRDQVGFPTSAGVPANTILCHRFDPGSAGMHLIAPFMSSTDVRSYDFRGGVDRALPGRVLSMDDAYHPTVAAADLDHDGIDELIVSKLSGLYLFDVLDGSMKSSVLWTSNGERHRNYGLLQFHDIDGDGDLEVIIAADRVARHISVLDNDGRGNLSLMWDRFIEFIYPNDTTELRHTFNSVADLDGDGRLELVVAVFNGRGDGRWWLEVIDPCTGSVRTELPDRYLWGVQDLNGDGVPELLLSRETTRQVKPFSRVEVVSCLGGAWHTLWEDEGLHFAGRDLRPEGLKSEFRPALFGHNETWVDPASGVPRAFLFRDPRLSGHAGSSFLELSWEKRSFCTRSSELPDAPAALMAGLADLDGDGKNERILSDAGGGMHILSAEGAVTVSFRTGFRLPLEGYYIGRPAQTPVIYGGGKNGPPRIALIDNTNMLHLLQEQGGGRSVRELWRRPARGCVGYDLAFHSAYVCDIDGDGILELLVTDPVAGRPSRLVAFGPDGEEKGSWEVPGAAPVLPLRIGTYMWQVLPFGGENRIVAASFASYSMNSEGSVCFGLDGRSFWRLTEYGEGEWGRGMGPWSAYSSLPGPRGTPRLFFLAKDLVCEVDAADGSWRREPWLLWRATTVAMGQPEWEFTKDRLPLFGTEKDPFTAYGSPILVDVDGDGQEEIVIGGCFGGMGVLKDDHTVLWWKRTPFTDVTLRLPGIADLDGSGNRSVGVCHADGAFVCYDGRTGRESWTIPLGTTTSDIVSCDIDGDGREEFIMGTTDGRLLAIGEDPRGRGTIRWSVELGSSVGTPSVADTNGDGLPEIIAVAGDGSVYCIAQTAPISP